MAAAELLFSKLVVFGATGPTGRQVVEQALKKGHLVSAVVRNPDKFDVKHDNLEVCKGDIFSTESLVPILQGKDAVISCLGFHEGNFFRPTTLYSQSIKTIGFAMETTGLERIVCITGIYTQKDPSNPRWMDWFARPFMRQFINDMIAMENYLMESKLCYTIMRPPVLKDEPAKGSYLVFEGQSVPNAAMKLPFADLAEFMLSSLQTQDWNRKGVAIANKK